MRGSYEAGSRVSRTDHPLTHPTVNGLEAALSEPVRSLLRVAMAVAEARQVELWAVGGAVRDLAAGLRVRDLDLGVGGDAGALAEAVARRTGGIASIEERFGTASVEAAGCRIDLAGLRTETYARPGALPAVRLGATIEEDLARRDFSVNAVALALTGPRTGGVVDPCGGLADLGGRWLRVLHARSFIEDATRLWRGARYAARLGLRPTAETARLIEEGGRWLASISGQRLWAEFERTAEERRILQTLRLLDGWGVLEATCAGFALSEASEQALRRRRAPIPPAMLLAVLLAPLERDVRAAVTGRLHPPRQVARAVEDAARLLEAEAGDLDALERLGGTGEPGRTAARWLEPERQHELQGELRRWERTRAHLDASDVLGLGVRRGPAVGAVLLRLRRERYLGTLAGAAEARRAVRLWLAEEPADDG